MRSRCVRVANQWWETCYQFGRKVIKRWTDGQTEPTTITYKSQDGWSCPLSSTPSFGDSTLLYFVDKSKVTVILNKDLVTSSDTSEFELKEIMKTKLGRENILFTDPATSPNFYYSSYFHLSKNRLLARYIEYKPYEECIHKIEDLIYCFKQVDHRFVLQNRHCELVEWDNYYSHLKHANTQFKFFSHLDVDYVLTYSVLKPLFSLSFYQGSSSKLSKLLRWGKHLKVKEQIESFSMDYDEVTQVLAAATFYRSGINKYTALPQSNLYRIVIE